MGNFRLDEFIREGGTCQLFTAVHINGHQRRIIRVLRRDIARAHPRLVDRLIESVRSTIDIEHTNLARVYDYGVTNEAKPRPYIVTEKIEGQNLQEWVETFGPMPWTNALHVLRQLLHALKALHDEGRLHCDVTPQNVMLTERAGDAMHLKVIDFDLSREIRAEREPGISPGTPSVLAPELAMGLKPTVRSDLYAAGVTAYLMLAGRLPYDELTFLQALRDNGTWPRVRKLHISDPQLGIPWEFSTLVARLIHPDRAERPGDVDEALKQLNDIDRDAIVAARMRRRDRVKRTRREHATPSRRDSQRTLPSSPEEESGSWNADRRAPSMLTSSQPPRTMLFAAAAVFLVLSSAALAWPRATTSSTLVTSDIKSVTAATSMPEALTPKTEAIRPKPAQSEADERTTPPPHEEPPSSPVHPSKKTRPKKKLTRKSKSQSSTRKQQKQNTPRRADLLDLPAPPDTATTPAVEVPSVYHETLELAQIVLRAQDFKFTVTPTAHRGCDQLSNDTVLSQMPPAGKRVPAGTPVRLNVCRDSDS